MLSPLQPLAALLRNITQRMCALASVAAGHHLGRLPVSRNGGAFLSHHPEQGMLGAYGPPLMVLQSTDRQTDRQDRSTDRHTDKIDRQTSRQTDRQTDRQDRSTGRQTDNIDRL